jgi:hypothetical protein
MILVLAILIPFLVGAVILSKRLDEFDQKAQRLVNNMNKYIKENK